MPGSDVTVRVGWTLPDYLKHYGFYVGWAVVAVHTIVFVILLAGARWSGLCWRILTDPIWGKAGVWFQFAFRHIRPLQRWILARWFEENRQTVNPQPYLPVTLSSEGQVVGMSTDVLGTIRSLERLWVQGNAGMGKTALVSFIREQYFGDEQILTLEQAFRRYRVIPIIVPLREYRNVQRNPNAPGDWVVTAACMQMHAFRLPFQDVALFRAMIRSGQFVLVLDGANELEFDDEIELFARSAPSACIIVTSQTAGGRYFTNWRLPRTVGADLPALLKLYLGDELGMRTFTRNFVDAPDGSHTFRI